MPSDASNNAASALADLARDYWLFKLDEEPVTGIEHGHKPARRMLFRESIEDYARRDAAHADFQQRLAAIDDAALSHQELTSARLLKRELDEARERYALDEHLRPLMFPFGPDAYIAYAINKTVLQSDQDAQDYRARLATVPQYLMDFAERLQLGAARGHRLPAALLPRILASVESHLAPELEASVWYSPLQRSPAQLSGAIANEIRELISEKVQPAYRRFAAQLRELYGENTRDSLACTDAPQGDAYYRFIARHYTTVDLSLDEIHEVGLAELERIAAEIESVAAEAGFANDVPAFHQHLRNDPQFQAASGEELREKVEVLAKRIDRRIPEFFTALPRMTYGVESIPVAISPHSPPAYAQPNPADGSSAGIFWVSSLPDRCPSYMHIPLVLHEAWPGHLMHLASLQEMQDLPDFRRHGAMGYIAYVEGWALYCESLGEDMGLYVEPHQRFGKLEMEMWRALRLVVDTGLHIHGWSRDQAIALFRQHMTLSDDTIAAEVDRYIGLPGQALSYKIGEMKITELRRRAEKTLANRFNLKDFHQRLINAGPVTLPLLESHVQQWMQDAV